jgi:hypothetical protein
MGIKTPEASVDIRKYRKFYNQILLHIMKQRGSTCLLTSTLGWLTYTRYSVVSFISNSGRT